MRKQKGLPPNCYWRGGVIWARKQIGGAIHRFTLRTDNPAVARARVREFSEKQTARVRFGDHRRTWSEALNEWNAWVVQDTPFSESTYDRYLVSLKQLGPYLNGLFVDQIDAELIDTIVTKRRSVVIRQRKVAAKIATVRRDLTALSSVLRFCVDKRWTRENAALAKLQSPRFRERRDPIVLPDPAHIEIVVAKAPGMLKDMIHAARLTGCRQEELSGATRANFDRQRRQLTVVGKGNKGRTIDLGDEAFALFDRLPEFLRSPYLFWHDEGERYRNVDGQFSALARDIAEKAQKDGTDFRRFRFHDLRHYYAVQFLKNGGNIYILKGHLGHTSVKTTEWYLRFLTPEEQLAAMYGAQNPSQVQRSASGESGASA